MRAQRTRSLDLGTTFSACRTTGGAVLVRPHGRDHLLVLDGRLSAPQRIELGRFDATSGMALCEQADLLAVAGATQVTMLDAQETRRWERRHPKRLVGQRLGSLFSADARLLWLLLDATLHAMDARRGEVLDAQELRVEPGAAWSIHGPHPSAPSIFLHGATGRGTTSIVASFVDGRIALDEGKRSSTFLAYADAGATYAAFAGDRLDWETHPAREVVHSFPLGVDDPPCGEACSLGGRRLLLATRAGRLHVADPTSVAELHLDGDDRAVEWSTVIVAKPFLVTARRGDRALTSWDLRTALGRPPTG